MYGHSCCSAFAVIHISYHVNIHAGNNYKLILKMLIKAWISYQIISALERLETSAKYLHL